jgi:hypothetical protein
MPGIYFIITIFVGITLYLVLSLIWKQEQEQDKQKYGKILDNSTEFQFHVKTNSHNPSKINPA